MFLFWIWVTVFWVAEGQLFSHSFVSKAMCNLTTRKVQGCAQLQPGVFSAINECLLTCNAGCMGVSFNSEGCFHHTRCTVEPVCATNPNGSVMFEKQSPCLNNGQWDDLLDTCQCNGGFVGQICERYASSCYELTQFGYAFAEHEVVLQLSTDSIPVRTLCDLTFFFKQNTYLFKSSGNLRPRCRSWKEYKHGFWFDAENFWIGLDNMKILNKDLNVIYLETRVNNIPFGYRYSNFSLSPENLGFSFVFKYAITFNFLSGHVDCLWPVQATPFSSIDNDQDRDANQNCASLNGAGWWWSTCSALCNPLGSWSDRRMGGLNMKDGRDYVIAMYYSSI